MVSALCGGHVGLWAFFFIVMSFKKGAFCWWKLIVCLVLAPKQHQVSGSSAANQLPQLNISPERALWEVKFIITTTSQHTRKRSVSRLLFETPDRSSAVSDRPISCSEQLVGMRTETNSLHSRFAGTGNRTPQMESIENLRFAPPRGPGARGLVKMGGGKRIGKSNQRGD